MPAFSNKKFRGTAEANTVAARYRSLLARHPFALFGFPFIITMVAGSFFLTPATAIRYEKHDRRVRRLTKEEELGIGKAGRKVDMKEEYYVCLTHLTRLLNGINKYAETCCEGSGRLGTKESQAIAGRARWCDIIETNGVASATRPTIPQQEKVRQEGRHGKVISPHPGVCMSHLMPSNHVGHAVYTGSTPHILTTHSLPLVYIVAEMHCTPIHTPGM